MTRLSGLTLTSQASTSQSRRAVTQGGTLTRRYNEICNDKRELASTERFVYLVEGLLNL